SFIQYILYSYISITSLLFSMYSLYFEKSPSIDVTIISKGYPISSSLLSILFIKSATFPPINITVTIRAIVPIVILIVLIFDVKFLYKNILSFLYFLTLFFKYLFTIKLDKLI